MTDLNLRGRIRAVLTDTGVLRDLWRAAQDVNDEQTRRAS